MSEAPTELLSAPYTLEYTYTRSTGPVIGRFLSGLRAKKIEGVRTTRGRVLVPPLEYDPDTGEAVQEFVEVAAAGVVKTWTWNREARRGQPLDQPFAWALIQLDGADTALLHAVDVSGPEQMQTGMRVEARWAEERSGRIQDIACFVPEGSTPKQAKPNDPASADERVALLLTPTRLDYTVVAGQHLTQYLRGFTEKRILGARCEGCQKVLLPPRGACPTCGIPTVGTVEVQDIGTLTTFCIISIPFGNMPFDPPYVAGMILLDGADMPIFHLVRGIEPHEARMGMRIKAVWKSAEQLGPTLESISWFEPNGEADASFDSFKEHL